MPEEKPSPEPEGPPAPAKGEKPERAPRKKAEEKEEPKAPKGPKKLEGVKEDFRYIVRMANTDLDGTRAVAYSLTSQASPRPRGSGTCPRNRRTRSRRRSAILARPSRTGW